jgi:hypothetical protein
MIASTFVYAGVVLLLAGLALTARPVAAVGVATRPRAMAVAAAGVVVALASLAAPAFTSRTSASSTRLDEFAPEWQFHEVHERHIAAPPARVYAALREVRADEIAFFSTLTWIRRFGRPLPPGVLNAGHEPIIDVAVKGGFTLLADDTPRELLLGTVVAAPPGPRQVRTFAFFKAPPPGFAVATMNFLVKADGAGGTWLSTETRVVATSPSARRVFAAYWRVIYPGSALIRRMWLRAVERRAVTTPGQ